MVDLHFLEDNFRRLKNTNEKLLKYTDTIKDELRDFDRGLRMIQHSESLFADTDYELEKAKSRLVIISKAMEHLNDRIKKGTIENKTLSEENAKLAKEFESMNADKDKTIQELKGKINELEKENVFLKSGMKELLSEMSSVLDDSRNIKGEIARIADENKAVKKNMAAMNEKMTKLELEAGEANSDVKEILALLQQRK